MFQSVLYELINYYFESALNEAESSSGSIDQKVISAIAEDAPDAASILAKWIVSYSAHRVHWYLDGENSNNTNSFSEEVSSCAIKYFRSRNNWQLDTVSTFGALHREIHTLYCNKMGKQRSFISLTSKILWCFQPTDTPIYDDYAYRAVVMLNKLRKACNDSLPIYNENNSLGDLGFEELKWEEGPKMKNDVWWYNEFYQCHKILFSSCKEHIAMKLAKKENKKQLSHVDALRVFDKVLWLFGNINRDFSART